MTAVTLLGLACLGLGLLVACLGIAVDPPARQVHSRPIDRVVHHRSIRRPSSQRRRRADPRTVRVVRERATAVIRSAASPVPRPPLQRLLDRAGNPLNWSADRVAAVMLAGGVCGFVVGSAIGLVVDGPFRGFIVGLVAALLAAVVPLARLRSIGNERARAIRSQFSDAVDVVAITVAAGLAFDAALRRVTTTVSGPLAEELTRLRRDIALGTPRALALRTMAERVALPEITTFTTAVSHAEAVGAPLAETLRAQADTQRINRSLRIEERAQQLPVKLVIPLVFCILPALFVVVVGPAVVNILGSGVLP